MLEKIKTLIGIEGTDLDIRLTILLESAQNRVLAFLTGSLEKVPNELEWIVIELAVMRFNRIGNEGMTSYGQDGQTISFTDDDMRPFVGVIDAWNKKQEENTKGVVRFL